MKQTSNILLVVLHKNRNLEEYCISNYKYICYNNKIDYDLKTSYSLIDIFDNSYEYILCMNHFSCFTKKNIESLILNMHSNLLIPQFVNLPLESIPFIIKNCTWSRNFIQTYSMSSFNNLYDFINNLIQKDNISYSNLIQVMDSNNFYHQQSIINSYILFSQKVIIEVYRKNNLSLGIL